MPNTIRRKPPGNETQMIPRPIDGENGIVAVDVTWGKIQPMRAAKGVRTIGEPAVVRHLERGMPVIDVRASSTTGGITIPGSLRLSHDGIIDCMDKLNRDTACIFFCNGPQCPQSPSTIVSLLENGYSADKMLYYRGGMHDWITLGLPVEEIEQ